MFTRILVPLDWSAPCASAVGVATALAAEQKAHLLFLHVRETVVDLGLTGFAAAGTAIVEATQREIDDLLAGAVKKAARREVPASELRESGAIPDTILRVCERENCDLIVLGTHGRSGLARAFIGSVTEEVLRRCTVPVLAIHVPASP